MQRATVLDKVYGHRHIDQNDGPTHIEELWQYDHALNNNHECDEYFLKTDSSEDVRLKVLRDMYGSFYGKWTHFNSAFRGAVLQSTIVLDHDGEFLAKSLNVHRNGTFCSGSLWEPSYLDYPT